MRIVTQGSIQIFRLGWRGQHVPWDVNFQFARQGLHIVSNRPTYIVRDGLSERAHLSLHVIRHRLFTYKRNSLLVKRASTKVDWIPLILSPRPAHFFAPPVGQLQSSIFGGLMQELFLRQDTLDECHRKYFRKDEGIGWNPSVLGVVSKLEIASGNTVETVSSS